MAATKTSAQTIPPATQSGDCVTIDGMTVCPHLVHLTKAQKKTVYAMHRKNVAKAKKLGSAAKKKARKKKTPSRRT